MMPPIILYRGVTRMSVGELNEYLGVYHLSTKDQIQRKLNYFQPAICKQV